MLPSMAELRATLQEIAVPADAEPMAAYMKHRFTYFGIKTPARRTATKALLATANAASATDLLDFAETCWRQPEREFHYVGADVLKAAHASFEPDHLDRLHELITTNAWWDTVDSLASWPVGSIVDRERDAVAVMDDWLHSPDIWVARTAILHQLRRKDTTDTDRLFSYALTRASDTEFFIRKAIGWSLRQYAHTDPDAVVSFVDRHGDALSGLTRREALKNAR